MRVRVTRVDPTLPLPQYTTQGATGFDFLCRVETVVEPRSLAKVPGNLIVCVPHGYVLAVAFRSSTPARTGLICPHGVGIIDQDYCGPNDEIAIQVYNPSDAPVVVGRGTRIAQGLLMPVDRVEWEETGAAEGASRGGFGSTG